MKFWYKLDKTATENHSLKVEIGDTAHSISTEFAWYIHCKRGQESKDNHHSGQLSIQLCNEKINAINALVPSHQCLTLQEITEDIGRFRWIVLHSKIWIRGISFIHSIGMCRI